MVWPITGAESYVCETGKSMKGMELADAQEDWFQDIAFGRFERKVVSRCRGGVIT